jgi:cell division protein DivIC
MKTKLINVIRNKYLLTILVFGVWMAFFDQNKYNNQRRLQDSLNRLEAQKAFFIREIEENKNMTEALSTDSTLMEKYAREKYLMKRPNEVIYLIAPENE